MGWRQSIVTSGTQNDHVTITLQNDYVHTWQNAQHVFVLASHHSKWGNAKNVSQGTFNCQLLQTTKL